mmetsp:Transcript_8667/g.23496  ORF Transcript_8667/g.23496 Transcript_8667/m.23496 type:complete len:231 (-) Transcript_8667:615-1307(-)
MPPRVRHCSCGQFVMRGREPKRRKLRARQSSGKRKASAEHRGSGKKGKRPKSGAVELALPQQLRSVLPRLHSGTTVRITGAGADKKSVHAAAIVERAKTEPLPGKRRCSRRTCSSCGTPTTRRAFPTTAGRPRPMRLRLASHRQIPGGASVQNPPRWGHQLRLAATQRPRWQPAHRRRGTPRWAHHRCSTTAWPTGRRLVHRLGQRRLRGPPLRHRQPRVRGTSRPRSGA